MATLTDIQKRQIDEAYARVQSGQGSPDDKRNVDYAINRLQYTPVAQQVYSALGQAAPQATPSMSTPSIPQIQAGSVLTPEQRAQFSSAGYQYLGTSQGVAEAKAKYGSRVQSIAGHSFIVPKGLEGPRVGQPIDAGNLSSYQELSKILGSQVTPDMISPEIAGLLALQGKTTSSEQEYSDIQKQLVEQMKTIGGQGQDLQAELEKAGVPQAYQQVKELNLRAAQLQGELEQFDVQTRQAGAALGDQPIPTGLIQGQQQKLQQQRDLSRLGKAAELAGTIALSNAYQGNAQLGSQLAQQAVDLKYQPILNNLDVLKTQLSFAGEKMAKEDQKRASIISSLVKIKEDEIAAKKATEQQIQQLAIDIASIGAPLDVVRNVQKMSDPVAAAQAAGSWKRQFDLAEEARKRSLSGPGTISSEYKLTSDQRSALIGAGFSTEDIQNIQDNIKNGYTIDDILNIPGLSDVQRKALGETFTVPTTEEQFLTQDYFAGLYGGLGSSALKKAAKKAGFGGFLGGLTGVSTKEQQRFLDSIEGKVKKYRQAGYSDKEILKLMQK